MCNVMDFSCFPLLTDYFCWGGGNHPYPMVNSQGSIGADSCPPSPNKYQHKLIHTYTCTHSLTLEGEGSTCIWPGHSQHSECFWSGNMMKLSTMRLNHGTFINPVKLLRRWHKSIALSVAILPILTKSFPERNNIEGKKSKGWREKSSPDDIIWNPEDGQINTETSSAPILSSYMSQYLSCVSQLDLGSCHLQLRESLLMYVVRQITS